jgi:hypothetical protein
MILYYHYQTLRKFIPCTKHTNLFINYLDQLALCRRPQHSPLKQIRTQVTTVMCITRLPPTTILCRTLIVMARAPAVQGLTLAQC